MNQKIIFYVFVCTVLSLPAYAQQTAGRPSATEQIAAQVVQDPGDIYRGTVFGAQQKQYGGTTTLGTRKEVTKKYVYDTSLIRGIKIGDPDRVRTLMYAHVDVNEKSYAGITPLTIAAEKGNMEIIKMLVEDGKAHINDKSSYGITPLISAAAAGNGEVVEYLVAQGANVNDKDDMGNTALLYLVHFDQPKAVASLIQFDNTTVNLPDTAGNTPLIYAAQKALQNNAKALLAQGALVDYRNPNSGIGALATAAAEGHIPMVRLLAKNGQANLNLQDLAGQTPIFYAVDRNQPEMLRTLISLGADINAQDLKGKTPLMLAIEKDYRDCFNLLLRQKKSIDLNIPDFKGRSAIIYSANSNDLFLAQKLLAAGANIEDRDALGNTPLLTAIQAQNERLALFFMQQGADLTAANKKGENAFTLTDKFLPNSSLSHVLGVKRVSLEQQALRVEAQRLAQVRSLEQELAQQEEEARQLQQAQEAAEKQAAAAQPQPKTAPEPEPQTAPEPELDPELRALQEQLDAVAQ